MSFESSDIVHWENNGADHCYVHIAFGPEQMHVLKTTKRGEYKKCLHAFEESPQTALAEGPWRAIAYQDFAGRQLAIQGNISLGYNDESGIYKGLLIPAPTEKQQEVMQLIGAKTNKQAHVVPQTMREALMVPVGCFSMVTLLGLILGISAFFGGGGSGSSGSRRGRNLFGQLALAIYNGLGAWGTLGITSIVAGIGVLTVFLIRSKHLKKPKTKILIEFPKK